MLMWFAVDIKELKLLGDFNHPNIVRFVRTSFMIFIFDSNHSLQLGVSIPENPRDTPVMIVSELCSNGDLFDYIRNVNPPSLYKVVRSCSYVQFCVVHLYPHAALYNA